VSEYTMLEMIEEHCKMKNDKKSIACSDATRIAEKLETSVSKVGKLCNENGIKIIGCQLGCF